MGTIEAQVTPEVMKWARESAKLDLPTAAQRIGRSEEEIRDWETGEKRPSLAQARRASEVYRRSLAVFYLPEPPKEFDTLRDFRQLPQGKSREWSPELALLIRRIRCRQEWLREFLVEEGFDRLSFVGSASLSTESASLTGSIHNELGVAMKDQIACHEPRLALNLWAEHAEDAGINICQEGGVDSEEARGFVLADDYAPFIYINSNDSYGGRLFTLIHELVHLWINQPGISNLQDRDEQPHSPEARIERFCNSVAADVLVDKALLQLHWSQQSQGDLQERVHDAAMEFAVSEEVVARRLLELHAISEQDYLALRQYYASRWAEYRKRQKERRGRPRYAMLMAKSNGYRFTRMVFDAYRRDRISGRDASSLLHVKVNNFSKVAQEVQVSGGDR